MLFVLLFSNGLSEFLEFSKPFCNFHINILGTESYGKEIIENIGK